MTNIVLHSMKHIISMIVVALAAVGMVDAKPEVRPASHPVMQPIAHPTNPELEKPKFHGKRHGHKHHVRPHRCHKHGVRPMPCKGMKRHHRKPMMNAPIVRPARKVKK